MKLSVAKDQSPQPGDVIEFTSIMDPEISVLRSYGRLVSMGIRHDVAASLAPVHVQLQEDIRREADDKEGEEAA